MEMALNLVKAVWGFLKSPEGAQLAAALFTLLYVACEALAHSEKFKSNSVMQLMMSGMKWLKEKLAKPALPPQ